MTLIANHISAKSPESGSSHFTELRCILIVFPVLGQTSSVWLLLANCIRRSFYQDVALSPAFAAHESVNAA
jgi:hypothetical protein